MEEEGDVLRECQGREGEGKELPLDQSGQVVHALALDIGRHLVGHVLALAVTRRGNVGEEMLSELLHVTVRPARDPVGEAAAAA